MARSDPSARSARRAAQAGLSITELLIYLLLGGVLAAAAASLVVSNVRTGRNLELRQRAVDLYGRINHLLQLEISEGSQIAYNAPLPAGCGPGTPLFSVNVPSPLNTSEQASPPARIHYYSRNNGNDLWRCGPGIDENGFDLFDDVDDNGVAKPNPLPNPHFDALVSANTQLVLTNTTDQRALNYRVTLLGPDGEQVVFQAGTDNQPLIARTGVHLIRLTN